MWIRHLRISKNSESESQSLYFKNEIKRLICLCCFRQRNLWRYLYIRLVVRSPWTVSPPRSSRRSIRRTSKKRIFQIPNVLVLEAPAWTGITIFALLVGRLVFAVVQVTFDAASHVIDSAKILKTATTTKLALTRVANANTIQTNVHPVDIKVASVADQVPDSAVAPPVVAVDPAVATWSLTVQQESRDTMDSLSRLTRASNLKWTKWTVLPDNAQVCAPFAVRMGRRCESRRSLKWVTVSFW